MREDMAMTEEVVEWVVVASLEVGEVAAMVAEVEAMVVVEAEEVLHLLAIYCVLSGLERLAIVAVGTQASTVVWLAQHAFCSFILIQQHDQLCGSALKSDMAEA